MKMGCVVLLMLLQSLSSAQLSSVLKKGELTVDEQKLGILKLFAFSCNIIFHFHHEEILAKDIPLGF